MADSKKKTLTGILLADGQRALVDAEFVGMIRDFLAGRSGLKGMAYRTGMAMLEKARPGIVERAVQKLLPQFIQALEPLYSESRRQGVEFSEFLQGRPAQAAATLVAVADARMSGASDTARKYYQRFRGSAEDEVQTLIPALSALIQRHL